MRIDTHTPHVEPDWAQAFVVELRLRGVRGPAIGAALAEVEAHCSESGESAGEAFGDPTAYAVALDPHDTVAVDWPRELLHSGSGLVGMLVTLAAVGSLQAGTPVDLTWGVLGVLALVVTGAALLARHADTVLRTVVRRWWVAPVGGAATAAAFAAVLLAGRRTLAELPAVAVLVVGLAVILAHTVASLRRTDLEDPVVGPEQAGGAGTVRQTPAAGVLERLTPWLFPVLTVAMALPLLLL